MSYVQEYCIQDFISILLPFTYFRYNLERITDLVNDMYLNSKTFMRNLTFISTYKIVIVLLAVPKLRICNCFIIVKTLSVRTDKAWADSLNQKCPARLDTTTGNEMDWLNL